MLNHVTDAGKRDPWRDIIAPVVQTSNFVVLDNIAMHGVVISDGQREAACREK